MTVPGITENSLKNINQASVFLKVFFHGYFLLYFGNFLEWLSKALYWNGFIKQAHYLFFLILNLIISE